MQIRWEGILMDDLTIARKKQDIETLMDALAKQNEILVQMASSIQALNQRCTLASERILNLEMKTSGVKAVSSSQGKIYRVLETN